MQQLDDSDIEQISDLIVSKYDELLTAAKSPTTNRSNRRAYTIPKERLKRKAVLLAAYDLFMQKTRIWAKKVFCRC